MPSNAQVAADAAIAWWYGDREALLEALRSKKETAGLPEHVIQRLADMLMEDASDGNAPRGAQEDA